jgi:hypothetical protein
VIQAGLGYRERRAVRLVDLGAAFAGERELEHGGEPDRDDHHETERHRQRDAA